MKKDDNKQYMLLLPAENNKATFNFIPTGKKNPNNKGQSFKKLKMEKQLAYIQIY